MAANVGELQPALAGAARLPSVTTGASLSLVDIAVLALAGFAAACAEAWIHLNLKMPGHAILRAVMPMMFGLALVPRRGAGTAMGLFAAGGALVLNRFPGESEGISLAAGLAMTLVGPAIDLALWGAKASRWLYVRFALAGVLANLAALTTKTVAVSLGLLAQKGPLATYLIRAVPSYLICGAIAGLIAGAVCFRATPTHHGDSTP